MPDIVSAENRTIDTIYCVQIATTSLKTKFNEYDTKKSGEIFFDDFCSMFQVSKVFISLNNPINIVHRFTKIFPDEKWLNICDFEIIWFYSFNFVLSGPSYLDKDGRSKGKHALDVRNALNT